MSEADASYHPRFSSGGDIVLLAMDGVKFRFELDTLLSYSAPSSILHDMTDLPPSHLPEEQVVPLTHARGPTLAFLLDCILETEKRKAAGVVPLNAVASSAPPSSADGSDADSGTGTDRQQADSTSVNADHGSAEADAKETAPAIGGLPRGRHERNKAKAAIFSRTPHLPPLPVSTSSTPDVGSLLLTQPPSPALSSNTFATAPTSPIDVDGSDTESSGVSEVTVTAGAPALHSTTFEEVLDVMIAFELGALAHVVFDALKGSCSPNRNYQPHAHALSAEFFYAFSCKYKVGNRSYWATRSLASAWRAAGEVAPEPVENSNPRPRVPFNALNSYALSLLDPEDFKALKDMFLRFNRALTAFVVGFTSNPPSDSNPNFGKACASCPVKAQYKMWVTFKREVLKEHVVPLIIVNPQFLRKSPWLGDNLRQHIACSRCPDRIIHMILHLWKRVENDAWSLSERKRRKRPRFSCKKVRSLRKSQALGVQVPFWDEDPYWDEELSEITVFLEHPVTPTAPVPSVTTAAPPTPPTAAPPAPSVNAMAPAPSVTLATPAHPANVPAPVPPAPPAASGSGIPAVGGGWGAPPASAVTSAAAATAAWGAPSPGAPNPALATPAASNPSPPASASHWGSPAPGGPAPSTASSWAGPSAGGSVASSWGAPGPSNAPAWGGSPSANVPADADGWGQPPPGAPSTSGSGSAAYSHPAGTTYSNPWADQGW